MPRWGPSFYPHQIRKRKSQLNNLTFWNRKSGVCLMSCLFKPMYIFLLIPVHTWLPVHAEFLPIRKAELHRTLQTEGALPQTDDRLDRLLVPWHRWFHRPRFWGRFPQVQRGVGSRDSLLDLQYQGGCCQRRLSPLHSSNTLCPKWCRKAASIDFYVRSIWTAPNSIHHQGYDDNVNDCSAFDLFAVSWTAAAGANCANPTWSPSILEAEHFEVIIMVNMGSQAWYLSTILYMLLPK